MTETATATATAAAAATTTSTRRSATASRENSMNERIAHWKKVNTKLKPPTSIETIKPTKFYQARGANAHANGDVELPPAAVTIDSDESWCSDDSAPFPLPLEQLNKYPAEQRKQQQEQNRFYNFFERYALEVSEAGVGLCSSSGKVDDRTANTVTDADVDADGDVNESMRHISIFDDSSVCAEDASGSNAANGSTTPGSTGEKKGVRWDPNLVSCNAVDYGDFYDRYMLVVTEVGASACGSKEATTSGGDQAGPAVALEKKNSPTSTTETDQVDVDYSKEQVESSQEEEWSPNQANCTEIDMCVDMARAVPFNLNKFWESLAVQNRCDEVDDVDDADQVQTRKQNPKRRKAREVSSSTFSREIDEDEEPDLDLDRGHSARDTSVVNLDDVNVMMDSVIDTVLSNELKGMATEFIGQVRSFVNEDACMVNDVENDTVTSENDAVNKRQ